MFAIFLAKLYELEYFCPISKKGSIEKYVQRIIKALIAYLAIFAGANNIIL